MSDSYYVDLRYTTKGGESIDHTIGFSSQDAEEKWSLSQWLSDRIQYEDGMLPYGDGVISLSALLRVKVVSRGSAS